MEIIDSLDRNILHQEIMKTILDKFIYSIILA